MSLVPSSNVGEYIVVRYMYICYAGLGTDCQTYFVKCFFPWAYHCATEIVAPILAFRNCSGLIAVVDRMLNETNNEMSSDRENCIREPLANILDQQSYLAVKI